jgi:hypothetical protein
MLSNRKVWGNIGCTKDIHGTVLKLSRRRSTVAVTLTWLEWNDSVQHVRIRRRKRFGSLEWALRRTWASFHRQTNNLSPTKCTEKSRTFPSRRNDERKSTTGDIMRLTMASRGKEADIDSVEDKRLHHIQSLMPGFWFCGIYCFAASHGSWRLGTINFEIVAKGLLLISQNQSWVYSFTSVNSITAPTHVYNEANAKPAFHLTKSSDNKTKSW